MKNKLFEDDKGFSLIELIVAVLIMAILAGGAIYAFSSVYSTEVKAGASKVCDALKQARVEAMALENYEYPMTGYKSTNVYARFYTSDNVLYIDVCKNPTPADGGSTATVLYTEKIGSGMKAYFQTVKADGTIDASLMDTGSNNVYVYFKKSTGGVAGVEKRSSSDAPSGGSNEIKNIKLENTKTGLSKNLILVGVTGRCFVDD